MKLFNTLSGKKEEVERPEGRPLNIFVCGPTVYDAAHLGHARTYIAFDALVRFLRAEGWQVFYLQNITDVDDKIIDRAREADTTPAKLAKEYEHAYRRTMKNIGVRSVDTYAPASKFIPQIVSQVERLIAKGFAYRIEESGYYFDITTFPDYGKLSGRTATQAEDAVTRIDEQIAKKNRGDFALWKFIDAHPRNASKKFMLVNGEPAWRASVGWGRPGWHIEDTAITEALFGPQYDIHGGAEDLKFPHHEAEIAQQEAASGKKPFVKLWLHTGFMRVRGEKMSKSLKNFVTIEQFLATYPALVLRWLVLSHHYRSPINFDDATIEQAVRSVASLQETLDKLLFISRKGMRIGAPDRMFMFDEQSLEARWHAALLDDFNTPEAFAAVFAFINELNPHLWKLSRKEAKTALGQIVNAFEMLGIEFVPEKATREAEALANERELYRGSKQFTQADALRKDVLGLGYTVDDTPLGPFVRRTPKS